MAAQDTILSSSLIDPHNVSNEQGNEDGIDMSTALLPQVTQATLITARSPSPLTKLILYYMAIHFLIAFADIVLIVPLMRLYEIALCEKHFEFPVGGVKEELCKIPAVQIPLATIRGWKSSFDILPVLLVSIPIGKYGDRYGHRKIIALALVGAALAYIEVFVICAFPKIFPLQLIWLSSFILLCGGGLNSAAAYMWAMASESIPTNRRSQAFYYIFSAFYIAELISSYVSAITTDISPWICCFISLAALLICLLILFVMPDPRKSPHYLSSLSDPSDLANSTHSLPYSPAPSFKHQSKVYSIRSTLSHQNVLLTVPVFLVCIFRYSTLNFLIQYASIRFRITISAGAKFYTETAAINIFLFLFLIPRVTAWFRKKYEIPPQVLDLFLVRASVGLMCIGCMIIGIAPSISILSFGVLIFASGFGARVSGLALITPWISPSARASLYASINVLGDLGHAIADPAMAHMFAAGMKTAPYWTTLPFLFPGFMYFIAIVSTLFIRIDPLEEDVVVDVDEHLD